MSFRDELKNFLQGKERSDIEVSEIRFTPDGSAVFYLQAVSHPPVRCKMSVNSEKYGSPVFYPMVRFNENHSPWDTTVKDMTNVFSSFPGIAGVAHRTVNTSLI